MIEDTSASAPKNRFLIVKLTVTNSGKDDLPLPQMALTNASGQTFSELSDIKEDLPRWFGGILRQLKAGQTETGVVAFDVPMAAYKLKVTDGGDIEEEKFAFIDIPLQLQ